MKKYYIDEIYNDVARLTVEDGKTIVEELLSLAELKKRFRDLSPHKCFEGLSWQEKAGRRRFRGGEVQIQYTVEDELLRVLSLQNELFVGGQDER